MTLQLHCQWLGEWAREALELKNGKVLGVTSKGIFLLFGQKIAFITNIDIKSPFVIHVEDSNKLLSIATGLRVTASGSAIYFPDVPIQIDLHMADRWTPPPPRSLSTTMPERMERIGALQHALKKASPNFQKSTNRGEMFLYATEFQTSFQNENLESCIDAGGKLLGLGSGLTPSGDDLLAGFMLYQTRFAQATSFKRPFIATLGKALTETAYVKTTTISANRIEAASRGWGEEIFLEVIDHLLDLTVGEPDNAVERLLGFGHSSGVETLQGIAQAASME